MLTARRLLARTSLLSSLPSCCFAKYPLQNNTKAYYARKKSSSDLLEPATPSRKSKKIVEEENNPLENEEKNKEEQDTSDMSSTTNAFSSKMPTDFSKLFEKMKKKLTNAPDQKIFEVGSVNYHVCNALALLLSENYREKLFLALEEFDKAVDISLEQKLFGFISDSAFVFLKDQLISSKRGNQDLVVMLLHAIVYERKNPEEALKILGTVIEFDPTVAEAFYFRALIQFRTMHNEQKAKEDLLMSIKIKPDYYQAYNLLGQIQQNYMFLSNNPQIVKNKVLEYLNKALELNPEYAPAYINRAITNMDTNSLEAIKDLKIALRFDERNPLVYFHLASIYSELGQVQSALDNFNKAIEYQPNNPILYQYRGDVYLKQLQDKTQAQKDFLKAQQLIHSSR